MVQGMAMRAGKQESKHNRQDSNRQNSLRPFHLPSTTLGTWSRAYLVADRIDVPGVAKLLPGHVDAHARIIKQHQPRPPLPIFLDQLHKAPDSQPALGVKPQLLELFFLPLPPLGLQLACRGEGARVPPLSCVPLSQPPLLGTASMLEALNACPCLKPTSRRAPGGARSIMSLMLATSNCGRLNSTLPTMHPAAAPQASTSSDKKTAVKCIASTHPKTGSQGVGVTKSPSPSPTHLAQGVAAGSSQRGRARGGCGGRQLGQGLAMGSV